VAHTTITIPYAIITIGASLQTLDRNLEEAAQILGASYFKTIFFITIPLIKSGLIGAFIFSFIISFDEFIVTYFLATFNQTLPIQIYSTLMFQLEPSIASISTLMLALTALLTLVLMSRGQLVSFGKIIK
jgi:putative spermidine/putrescine transport system permease protein